MKCAIYTRVSTDNQAEIEFNSCEAQEQKIKAYIKSQEQLKYHETYNDPGFTGANLNRPGFQRLLNAIEAGKVDCILVYKIDRLTRSLKDFHVLIDFLDRYKVRFISITESFDTSTPSGCLQLNIMLTFAQFERELASERVRDKMLERAKKGMPSAGRPPYGYSKKEKKLLPLADEASNVLSMYEKYVETGSLFAVYNALKSSGVVNRQGKIFTKKAVADILRNPIYTGKIRHRGVVYQGQHAAILSNELFDLAQQIHKEPNKKFKTYREHSFSGLVHCSECGYAMTPSFANKKSKGKLRRYFYYRCLATYKRDWNSCSVKQVSSDKLEKLVAANLQRIASDEMFIENYVYRLNRDPSFPGRAGFELPVSESHFSATGVQSAISGALAILQKAKGAEKNLLLKKYVKDIKYSKEKVEMAFYYRPAINSANNKGFEAGSQSATVDSKKSKSRSKSSGVSKPTNREPASDDLLRPAPAPDWFASLFSAERGGFEPPVL